MENKMDDILNILKSIVSIVSSMNSSWIQNLVITLSGAIVGAFIVYFTQLIGKVNIYVDRISLSYWKKNSEGDNVRGVQKEGCEYCTVDIVIDIFNSSMKSKLIRDINIEILNSHKKKIIGEVVISSNNIQMVEPYSLTIYPTILDRYSVRYYIRNDEIKSITETLYIYMNYKKYKQVTCKRNIFYGSISVSAY